MDTATQPRRPAARAAGIAGNVLLVGVFLLAAAYLVPSLMGFQRYIITGGSMTGTYDKGSVVYERVVPSADLKVGDVITYLPPPSSGVTNLVTHRIVQERTTPDGTRMFRTKGDANPSKDPWTFQLDHAQQPVVQFLVPHIGWVLLFLADPRHRTLLIGIPAGLVALASVLEAVRNARRAARGPATGDATGGATGSETGDAAAPVPAGA